MPYELTLPRIESFLLSRPDFDITTDAQTQSPFFRLPREIRNIIYGFALDPRADFLLTDDINEVAHGFCFPNMFETNGSAGPGDFSTWKAFLTATHEDVKPKQKHLEPFLAYRLKTSTPQQFNALTLCKLMFREAKEELDHVKVLIKNTVSLDRFIDSPDHRFLEIYSKSTLIIGTVSNLQWQQFWVHVPRSIRLRIHRLNIGPANTQELGRQPTAYFVLRGFSYVCENLPNLQFIGFIGDLEQEVATIARGLGKGMEDIKRPTYNPKAVTLAKQDSPWTSLAERCRVRNTRERWAWLGVKVLLTLTRSEDGKTWNLVGNKGKYPGTYYGIGL